MWLVSCDKKTLRVTPFSYLDSPIHVTTEKFFCRPAVSINIPYSMVIFLSGSCRLSGRLCISLRFGILLFHQITIFLRPAADFRGKHLARVCCIRTPVFSQKFNVYRNLKPPSVQYYDTWTLYIFLSKSKLQC